MIAVLSLSSGLAGDAQLVQTANESLWEASRAGDTTRIAAALNQGAEINAKSRYDVTALFFAAGSGHLEAVKLLVSRGANVNLQDSFYRATAAEMAAMNRHPDVAVYLVQNGANGDGLLIGGVQANDERVVKAAVAGAVTRQGLQSAMNLAATLKREALASVIKAALDKLPAELAPPAFYGRSRDPPKVRRHLPR